jgi:hypothetical protein
MPNAADDSMEFSDPVDEQESSIDEIPKELRALRTQAYDKSIGDLVEMIKNKDIRNARKITSLDCTGIVF